MKLGTLILIVFILCAAVTLVYTYMHEFYDPKEGGQIWRIPLYILLAITFPIWIPITILAAITHGWLWGKKKK